MRLDKKENATRMNEQKCDHTGSTAQIRPAKLNTQMSWFYTITVFN